MLSLVVMLAAQTAPAHPIAVPFGDGLTRMGLIREPESSPEAPGSIAVDAEGRVYVLDAVHSRVAVLAKDGALDASIPVPNDTVEDIALLPSGDLAVLDRLVARTVWIVAENGAVRAAAPVEGAGIPDGGDVTAVHADATGVWLEVRHGAQVRVLDAAGAVDHKRPVRAGLPLGGDRFVRLEKVGDAARVLVFNAAGTLVADGAVRFHDLLELSGLAVRGDDVIVLGHELSMARPEARPTRDVEIAATVHVHGAVITEVGARKTLRAAPEWVPLKQLTAGGGRVAHLYVNSLPSTGTHAAGIEVTSW